MNQDKKQDQGKQNQTRAPQHSTKPVEGDEQDIDQDLAQRQGTDAEKEQDKESAKKAVPSGTRGNSPRQ